jgi:hypothetical protein
MQLPQQDDRYASNDLLLVLNMLETIYLIHRLDEQDCSIILELPSDDGLYNEGVPPDDDLYTDGVPQAMGRGSRFGDGKIEQENVSSRWRN